MSSNAIERFDDEARRKFESMGNTTVYWGELLRHPVYDRFLHWSIALFFSWHFSPGSAFIFLGSSAGSHRFLEAHNSAASCIPTSASRSSFSSPSKRSTG